MEGGEWKAEMKRGDEEREGMPRDLRKMSEISSTGEVSGFIMGSGTAAAKSRVGRVANKPAKGRANCWNFIMVDDLIERELFFCVSEGVSKTLGLE